MHTAVTCFFSPFALTFLSHTGMYVVSVTASCLLFALLPPIRKQTPGSIQLDPFLLSDVTLMPYVMQDRDVVTYYIPLIGGDT